MVTERQKVGMWKQRIEAAKKVYEPEQSQWRRYEKLYKNKQWEDMMFDFPEVEDRITVNQVFPITKVMLNSTYSKNPYVYVRPAHGDLQSTYAAQILEPYINKLWNRDQNMKRTMRRVAMDAILRGKGFLRSGYSIKAIGDTVMKEQIIGERVSPYHIWQDPEAENVYEAYWTVRRVVMPWVDAKKMWPKRELGPAMRYELRPHEQSPSALEWHNNPELDDDMARAVVYEIHDHLSKRIIVVADGYDKFLSNRPDPYNIEGSLIDELCFNEIPETPFGLSDIATIEGQQLELNRVRTMMLTHIRRFNRKYLAQRDMLNEDEKKALESNEDGIVVECEDPSLIIPLKDAPMSGDVHMYEQRIQGDMIQSTGVNPWMRGEAVHPRKSAFEAQQMSSGQNLRSTEKPALMEDFASRVAEKQIKIMQQFLDEPIIDNLPMVPMGIPLNEMGLKAFSKDDIQGEFYVTVKPNSTQLPDKAQEQQMAMMMLQSGIMQDPNLAPWFWQYFATTMSDAMPGIDKAIGGMLQGGGGQGQQPGGGAPNGGQAG